VLDDRHAPDELIAVVDAGEQRVVAVVEGQPDGRPAGRRIPGELRSEEDVTGGGRLVSLELETVGAGCSFEQRDGEKERGAEGADGSF